MSNSYPVGDQRGAPPLAPARQGSPTWVQRGDPMSEQRAVSDLVFRDLAPEPSAPPTARNEEWQALLREELGKLRPARPAPRVVPASKSSRFERQRSPAE
jgi:hypothetical protein